MLRPKGVYAPEKAFCSMLLRFGEHQEVDCGPQTLSILCVCVGGWLGLGGWEGRWVCVCACACVRACV